MTRLHDASVRLWHAPDLQSGRIETGKLLLHFDHFFLNELIRETIETVQQTTNQHTIIFHDGASITLGADRFRLYQVLVNLLLNLMTYAKRLKASEKRRLAMSPIAP